MGLVVPVDPHVELGTSLHSSSVTMTATTIRSSMLVCTLRVLSDASSSCSRAVAFELAAARLVQMP